MAPPLQYFVRVNRLSVLLFTRDRLCECALFAGAGDLVTALQCLVDQHCAACRALVRIVRSTRNYRRIPVSRGALILSVVTATVEDFSTTRLFLDNLSATFRTWALDATDFENRSLLTAFLFVFGAGEIVAIATISDQHRSAAEGALFFSRSVFRNRCAFFGERYFGFAFRIFDATQELTET